MQLNDGIFSDGMKKFAKVLNEMRDSALSLEDANSVEEVAKRLNVPEMMAVRPMYSTVEEAQSVAQMSPEESAEFERKAALVQRVEDRIEQIFGGL